MSARFRSTSDIPDSPPPEVLDAVGAAAEWAERMEASGWELHFSRGCRTVELRDHEGNAVRTMRPSEALEMLTHG